MRERPWAEWVDGVLPLRLTLADAHAALTRLQADAMSPPSGFRRFVHDRGALNAVYLSCYTFDANIDGTYMA